jgi:hypothetical protein
MRPIPLAIVLATLAHTTTLAADTPAAGLPGTTTLQWRARVESVDDAAFANDATAATLRTRLTWVSPARRDWQFSVEVDDIRALDTESYNSTTNGQTLRPVIADPVDTELNRAVLEWKQPKFDLALGRQRLLLDNQRFIGNVGWRQNEQTYDGALLRWHASPAVDVSLAWISNVNRVFGPRSGNQSANWHGDSAILHARAKLGRLGDVSAFSYALDFDNAAGNSATTSGLLWSGVADLGRRWKMPWSASIASQRDRGGNPVDYSASYWQIELGVRRGPATLRLGQEHLAGDAVLANHRFQTPLATLHAFQGWADKFLITPPQGIDDRYLTLETTIRGVVAQAQWHDFRAAAGSGRYGQELDLSLSRKFGKRYELLGKYADYSASGFSSDTRKAWLMLTATFQ